MIVVCEPQCKKFSHEKINSAFLYAIRLAFPQEKIIFFGDNSHIEAIKVMLAHDLVKISDIEYRNISFYNGYSILAYFTYRHIFKTLLLKEIPKIQASHLVLLSFNGLILHVIKAIMRSTNSERVKIHLVLHGEFETINPNQPNRLMPRTDPEGWLRKLGRLRLRQIPGKVFIYFQRRLRSLTDRHLNQTFKKRFAIKKVMFEDPLKTFQYIALASYIVKNARNFLETDRLRFATVSMPMVFAPQVEAPTNTYVKFAVFGYGYSAMLQRVLGKLEDMQTSKNYEIRLISMDGSGGKGFRNVTFGSKGDPLARSEMENLARDIDIFLILYDKPLYSLSCSASIFEALSYSKPILHFDNDCINHFNRNERPIGFVCSDPEHYAKQMFDIIENYESLRPMLQMYRRNIAAIRSDLSVDKCAEQIKGCL